VWPKETSKNALPDYDRAIEVDPSLALAYANRGWARLRQGDKLGADKDFEQCFKLDEGLRAKFEALVDKRKRRLAEER
jgi:tetratricopeptide (TPR) repeat protein